MPTTTATTTATASTSTIRSLPSDPNSTYVPPDVPPAYLRDAVVGILLRRGFQSAEAGALAEIERLLERHISNLFEDAIEYAHLAGRRESNAIDLVAAHENSGWGVRGMRRESKRARMDRAPELPLETSPPPSPPRIPLSALIPDPFTTSDAPKDQSSSASAQYEDRKPDLARLDSEPSLGMSRMQIKTAVAGERLGYAEDWTPVLPEKHTYVSLDLLESASIKTTPQNDRDQNHPPAPTPAAAPAPVTSALLDFIKLTATERGDIPPELGVVDYRYRRDNQPGPGGLRNEGGKRKWGVKGVGVIS
ncbi:hypothetical protein I317_04070 [Kwoniella heveanensis CBS 569]|nr:hypothetical protein I317_04070 [Kwoniella heveanensis CBS 569]